MYNIISNLLVLLQVQQKIISILFLLATSKPLKYDSSQSCDKVPYHRQVQFKCPHCGRALSRMKERSCFYIWKCTSLDCSFYKDNLNSLSKKEREIFKLKPENFKLHYIFTISLENLLLTLFLCLVLLIMKFLLLVCLAFTLLVIPFKIHFICFHTPYLKQP